MAPPTVEGSEFVTVEPDEYALAPERDSRDDVLEWAERYCELEDLSPCTGIEDRAMRLCIEKWDCHPALLVSFDQGAVAFVGFGVFPEPKVVAVWRAESDPDLAQYGGAQKLLEDYLLTVNVCPEDQDSEYWGATCPG